MLESESKRTTLVLEIKKITYSRLNIKLCVVVDGIKNISQHKNQETT